MLYGFGDKDKLWLLYGFGGKGKHVHGSLLDLATVWIKIKTKNMFDEGNWDVEEAEANAKWVVLYLQLVGIVWHGLPVISWVGVWKVYWGY